jgi:hypothetical protein
MATVQHKTPGVYIPQPNSFPPAIVGVDTAVPAFIGYTEKAAYQGKSLDMIPTRIASMAEYIQQFGHALQEQYYLVAAPAGGDAPKPKRATDPTVVDDFTLVDGGDPFRLFKSGEERFNLFNSVRLFYDNGGGACYIVSCGTFDAGAVSRGNLVDGLGAIENVVGPTMLVVPDAVLLARRDDFFIVTVEMLQQCLKKRDRVAILDVWGGRAVNDDVGMRDAIGQFRAGLAAAPPESLCYGMAYFPFLRTSVVAAEDISIRSFAGSDGLDPLKGALLAAVTALYPATDGEPDAQAAMVGAYVDMIGTTIADNSDDAKLPPAKRSRPNVLTDSELAQVLRANIPGLMDMFHHAAESQNTLPPSGAMAGLFTTTDVNRGVWNAPVNVGINTLIAPTFEINVDQQQGLNVPTEGLAVNAIRTFPARGSLVWGARTLDSNSNNWRYIQVRRTMIYVEQSVKTSLNSFVFAPNTATTWTTVVSVIESFLHDLWASGGLMGAAPAQAFNVQCGLGSTMTADDILNGNMIVQVVLQMVHPAEFIELVLKQQMLGGS